MKLHTRHVAIAIIVMLILLIVATVTVSAQDYSGYSGAQLYSRFCASCHGTTGQGDGVVASSLYVMVPDLTRIAKRHGGTYPTDKVRQIVDGRTLVRAHGTRTMPVWGYEFDTQNAPGLDARTKTEQTLQKLVDYVASLQRE